MGVEGLLKLEGDNMALEEEEGLIDAQNRLHKLYQVKKLYQCSIDVSFPGVFQYVT